MAFRAILAVAMISIAGSAVAETIKQRGGKVYLRQIGGWHISKATYEDGSNVCWAVNLSYGRNEPVFAFISASGGKNSGMGFRFQAKSGVAAGKTVQLAIGGNGFQLVSGSIGFVATSAKQANAITERLVAREGENPKTFFVIDDSGKKHKYDARATSEMLTFLKGNCA